MKTIISVAASLVLFSGQSLAQDIVPSTKAPSTKTTFSPPPGAFNRFAAAYMAVVAKGELATTQDELVWNFGIVAEDLMGRSGGRWNQGEGPMIDEVQKTLCEGVTDCTQIKEDIDVMKEFGRLGGNTTLDIEIPVNRIMVAILDWLQTHPEPRQLFKKWPIR